MSEQDLAQVAGPDGSPITIELLDTNLRGQAWEGVGYRAAIAHIGRRRVEGYVHWLSGAWRFTARTRGRRRRSRRST